MEPHALMAVPGTYRYDLRLNCVVSLLRQRRRHHFEVVELVLDVAQALAQTDEDAIAGARDVELHGDVARDLGPTACEVVADQHIM